MSELSQFLKFSKLRKQVSESIKIKKIFPSWTQFIIQMDKNQLIEKNESIFQMDEIQLTFR